jgi:O-antigen ligase
MKISLRDIEKSFAIFSLILLTDALSFRSFFVASEGAKHVVSSSTPFDAFVALAQYFVFSISSILLLVSWKRGLRALLRNIFVFAFAVLILASKYWSDFPEITQRSALLFFLTTIFGLYLAARYSLKEQLKLIAISLGIIAVTSFLCGIAFPGAAIEQSSFRQGSWRGLFFHKNNLGLYMFLVATSLVLIAPKAHKHYRFLVSIVAGISFGLVILTNSKTALVIFLILMLLIPLCQALRWNTSRMIPCLLTLSLVIGSLSTWFVENIETFLGGLGKDLTFSGRTEIWAAMLESISQRPWFGYGYQAFWVIDSSKCLGECHYIRAAIHFDATSGHNGFMDLTANLGLVGLTFFLLSLLIAYQRSIAWIRSTSTAEDFWPLLLLTSIIIFTQSESAVLDSRSFLWAIYAATAFSLYRIKPM